MKLPRFDGHGNSNEKRERAFMNNQEPDLNPTPAETDSANTNESVQREIRASGGSAALNRDAFQNAQRIPWKLELEDIRTYQEPTDYI